jgi:hypothetical protein
MPSDGRQLRRGLRCARPPIKGVYRGGATAELDASVRMTRTDAAT